MTVARFVVVLLVVAAAGCSGGGDGGTSPAGGNQQVVDEARAEEALRGQLVAHLRAAGARPPDDIGGMEFPPGGGSCYANVLLAGEAEISTYEAGGSTVVTDPGRRVGVKVSSTTAGRVRCLEAFVAALASFPPRSGG